MSNDKLTTIELDNGLNIDVIDESKQMVGDRWKISLSMRMEIPIKNHMPGSTLLDVDAAELQKVIGETVTFEKKQERVFVDDKEKDAVVSDLIDIFKKELLAYVSNPEFPKRFIAKQYIEAVKNQRYNQ